LDITARTQVCAVIGDPVGHSLSPQIHNAAFRALGLDFVYVAFPVKRGHGREAVAAVRDLGIRGLSVTIPHKVDIMAHIDDVDPVATYGADRRPPHADGRPWVVVNMIASIDGATTVDGRSGGLGGPGDRVVFGLLRRAADVILVGAGTARAEGYRAPRPGQGRLAVVTRTGRLAGAERIFEGHRPYLVTTERAELAELGDRAEVLRYGDDQVALPAALAALGARGAGIVLCEGGPSLNGDLLAAGLVDEVCLTIAPVMTAGSSSRISHHPTAALDARFELAHVLDEDGFLFLRYVRSTPS